MKHCNTQTILYELKKDGQMQKEGEGERLRSVKTTQLEMQGERQKCDQTRLETQGERERMLG